LLLGQQCYDNFKFSESASVDWDHAISKQVTLETLKTPFEGNAAGTLVQMQYGTGTHWWITTRSPANIVPKIQ